MERDIERWLRREVEKQGGVCMKWVSPGNDGVPDRIVILPEGQVHFVELKSEKGRVSPLQFWHQARLKRLGCKVRLIVGMEEARAFLEEVSSECNSSHTIIKSEPSSV